MDRHERSVYLTFDDGPIPEATPFILDVLKRYSIKATFFMVGDNARKYPELHQRVIDEGHRIGNHTHNHIGGVTPSTNTATMSRKPMPTSTPTWCARPTDGCATTSTHGSRASTR